MSKSRRARSPEEAAAIWTASVVAPTPPLLFRKVIIFPVILTSILTTSLTVVRVAGLGGDRDRHLQQHIDRIARRQAAACAGRIRRERSRWHGRDCHPEERARSRLHIRKPT